MASSRNLVVNLRCINTESLLDRVEGMRELVGSAEAFVSAWEDGQLPQSHLIDELASASRQAVIRIHAES